MPVAIREIIRRTIFPSLYSLILIFTNLITFIITISVYTILHPTDDKTDNNRKYNEDNTWLYKDIKKEMPTSFSIKYSEPMDYIYYYIGFLLLILCFFVSLIVSRECIKYCLEGLYNWFFCRNQARQNEPVIHYRNERIYRAGQRSMHPLEYSSDEDF